MVAAVTITEVVVFGASSSETIIEVGADGVVVVAAAVELAEIQVTGDKQIKKKTEKKFMMTNTNCIITIFSPLNLHIILCKIKSVIHFAAY